MNISAELIADVERRGVYAAARGQMLKRELMKEPISIRGYNTQQYVVIPSSRIKGHREVIEAAARLWDEGFFTFCFYPDSDKFTPYLVAVWDGCFSNLQPLQMPCMLCKKEQHQRAKCHGCDLLSSWAQFISVKGFFLPGTLPSEEVEVISAPENKMSDYEVYTCIPTANQMCITSQAFVGENLDHFDESIYFRVMKRLERWPSSHLAMHFPFLSKDVSGYVTVPLTPREYTDSMILHRIIVLLEKKGYCCGPITSMANRTVLFVTWDEDLIYYFPAKSPCISDCEDSRGNISECYCTEFEAWLAKWNNMTQDIRVREQ